MADGGLWIVGSGLWVGSSAETDILVKAQPEAQPEARICRPGVGMFFRDAGRQPSWVVCLNDERIVGTWIPERNVPQKGLGMDTCSPLGHMLSSKFQTQTLVDVLKTSRFSILATITAATLFLAGCAGSEPPAAPLSPETYQASWLVVPVYPDPDVAELPDSDIDAQYKSMLDETAAALTSYDQRYSIYTADPSQKTGISADSIYTYLTETDRKERMRRLSPAVLREIASRSQEDFVLVIDPHNPHTRFFEPGVKIRPGPRSQEGFSVSFFIPLADSVKVTDRLTTATLFDARDLAAVADTASSLTPEWVGLRPLAPIPEPLFGSGPADRYAGWNARSIMISLMTGMDVGYDTFDLKNSGSVILYRHDRPTVRGAQLRVESVDFVVDDDGETVRVPIHQVSSIKSPPSSRRPRTK